MSWHSFALKNFLCPLANYVDLAMKLALSGLFFLSSPCRSFSCGNIGETTVWQLRNFGDCNVFFFFSFSYAEYVQKYRNLMNIKSIADCFNPISVALVLKWKPFVVLGNICSLFPSTGSSSPGSTCCSTLQCTYLCENSKKADHVKANFADSGSPTVKWMFGGEEEKRNSSVVYDQTFSDLENK